MTSLIPPRDSRPGWERRPRFHPMRDTPADPRLGLNRWRRFLYALKILAGRESFEERMGRILHD